jgi:hypothetical protein
MRPQVIIQNVCRFGLYADEIILINPFDNPNMIAEKFNPVAHPEEWIEETLKVLFQLMAMAPWVEKGFVTFIAEDCIYMVVRWLCSADEARKRNRRRDHPGAAYAVLRCIHGNRSHGELKLEERDMLISFSIGGGGLQPLVYHNSGGDYGCDDGGEEQ